MSRYARGLPSCTHGSVQIDSAHLASTGLGAPLARAAAMKGGRPVGGRRSLTSASRPSQSFAAASARSCRHICYVGRIIFFLGRTDCL